jgi:hypothetical protein
MAELGIAELGIAELCGGVAFAIAFVDVDTLHSP